MFHTKQLNNRINGLHEKSLRVTYQDRNSSFSEILNLDKSAFSHYRNIKYLLTEIYKVKMVPFRPIKSDIFSLSANSSCNLSTDVTMNRKKTGPPTSFSLLTFTNVGISPKNVLTFRINPIATLV